MRLGSAVKAFQPCCFGAARRTIDPPDLERCPRFNPHIWWGIIRSAKEFSESHQPLAGIGQIDEGIDASRGLWPMVEAAGTTTMAHRRSPNTSRATTANLSPRGC